MTNSKRRHHVLPEIPIYGASCGIPAAALPLALLSNDTLCWPENPRVTEDNAKLEAAVVDDDVDDVDPEKDEVVKYSTGKAAPPNKEEELDHRASDDDGESAAAYLLSQGDALPESRAQDHRGEPRQRVHVQEVADNQKTRVRKTPDIQRESNDERAKRRRSTGWSRQAMSWETWFELLVAFKDKHGHTRVSSTYVDGTGHKLGSWVHRQKTAYKKKVNGSPSSLSDERIEMLNSVAFEWEKDPWNYWFGLLVDFKTQHGHTRVPQNYVDKLSGRRLGLWVNRQREFYSQRCDTKNTKESVSGLSDERIGLLNAIGFEWSVCTSWESWFGLLVDYKKQHGHTRVSFEYVDGTGHKLGSWVHRQNTAYKAKQKGLPSQLLTEDRIQQLESIGFEWSCQGASDGDQKVLFAKEQNQLDSYLAENHAPNLNSVGFAWPTRHRDVINMLARLESDTRRAQELRRIEEHFGMLPTAHPWRFY